MKNIYNTRMMFIILSVLVLIWGGVILFELNNGGLMNYNKYILTSIEGLTGEVPIYNSKDYNVKYHEDISAITAQDIIDDASYSTISVIDPSTGDLIDLSYTSILNGPTTYYEPGTYLYGASTYVPNYEDSIYLSKTTGLSSSGNVDLINNRTMSGFCSKLQHNSVDLELKCNSIPNDQCASTSCCTLLGGRKCVSGNISGPYLHTNYSDYTIPNKEFYYYQGKCYGNCNV